MARWVGIIAGTARLAALQRDSLRLSAARWRALAGRRRDSPLVDGAAAAHCTIYEAFSAATSAAPMILHHL
jgi:hypothetical protein